MCRDEGGAQRFDAPVAQVALSWEAPENDGGFAITDYEVRINGRGSWISIGSTRTAHTVTGLVNGTIYVFQVRAVSAAGRSLPSNRAEATPGVGALDFAHFANGAGIISDLVFVNVATHPIRPVLYFYDKEGNPIVAESVVDLTEDLEVTGDGGLSIQTEMEPLGELTVSTHGRGELVSGSVAVAANGTIGGVLRFDLPGIGVAGVGSSPPVRDALFPARRQAGGIRTAAALHNLGEEAITVSCRLMSGGMVLEAVEIDLEANGQEARYIEELFTATDTSDFVGAVRCTAPGRFTGIAVELDAGNRLFTTLPVVPVARAGGGGQETVLYFAHFANGSGTTSDLVFVNVSPRPSGPGPHPLSCGRLSEPARPLLLRSGGSSHGPGIGGGSHGRSGGHRGRSPEHPDGNGTAGRTHDFHPWPGGAGERISDGGFRRSHWRSLALCPARHRGHRGGGQPTREGRPLPRSPGGRARHGGGHPQSDRV